MADELEGGCLCGRVRFRTTRAPLRTLACHCTFCQKVTGSSYFAESMFPKDAVLFNAGLMNSYEHVSDGSQQKVFVHFCPNCGTTLSLTFERWPDIRGIARGCYDDPDAVTVSSHIWTRSAQSGTALPEGVECFSKARISLDGQAEPSVRHASPVMARTLRDAEVSSNPARASAPEGITMSTVEATVTIEALEAFADAWNRHDTDALMSFMADDCVFEASAGPEVSGNRYVGREAVRAGYEEVFATFPDAHWGNARHFVLGSRGVSQWTFTGTRIDGSRVEVNGCDLFTFRDGKIAVKDSYRKSRAAAAAAKEERAASDIAKRAAAPEPEGTQRAVPWGRPRK